MNIDINGICFHVEDRAGSTAWELIASELRDDVYQLNKILFRPRDSVVDVGAHIGIFAIYLALRFPFLRIFSFEPFPPNRELLLRNISTNGVKNIVVHPQAISCDGRALRFATNPVNSGGATAASLTLTHDAVNDLPSITLDHAFELCGIPSARLLKIDCEGLEHEIFATTEAWSRFEYLRGEFHTNEHLRSSSCSLWRTLRLCKTKLGDRFAYTTCRMSE